MSKPAYISVSGVLLLFCEPVSLSLSVSDCVCVLFL